MHVDHTKNLIEVRNVSFAYNSKKVLDNVSMDIHQGDYLGVVGPNGGGKTTLIKIILGLLKPSTGSIKFTEPLKIGYVPQKATSFDTLFPATVEEVVAMGMRTQNKQLISDALGAANITNLRKRNIGDLSGGQQQRVFIARALASQPQIIFLDEPTVGVDTDTQEQFYALLKKLNHELDLTLVLISHDPETINKETTEVAYVNGKLDYRKHGSI